MNTNINRIKERDNSEFIGTIQIGTECVVSDPCYDEDIWNQYILKNMKSGNYNCFIKRKNTDFGERIAEISIYHENYIGHPNEYVEDIGVDSGQAGFYDKEYFHNTRNNKKWCQDICSLTSVVRPNPEYKSVEQLQEEHFPFKKTNELTSDEIIKMLEIISQYDRVIPRVIEELTGNCKDNKCCVSSTGFGDGCYDLYISNNSKKQVVSAKIRFLYC